MKPHILLIVALAFVSVAVCQVDPPAVTDKAVGKPATKAPFVFEAGDVPLLTLIEKCGAYLQYNILVDRSELTTAKGGGGRQQQARRGQGQVPAEAELDDLGPLVELQLPVITDHDGCEELLSSLLWSNGLALVPLDEPKRVYEVLAMNGQRAREIPMSAVQRTPEQVLARPTLRQFVTVVKKLDHTNATIATTLRPFFASVGNQGIASLTVGNVGNASAMIMTGPQFMVAGALLVVQAADVPPPVVRPDLEPRLEELAKQNEQLLQRLAALEMKVGKDSD